MHLAETTAVNHFYSFKDEEITSLVILFSSFSNDANEDTLQGNLRIFLTMTAFDMSILRKK